MRPRSPLPSAGPAGRRPGGATRSRSAVRDAAPIVQQARRPLLSRRSALVLALVLTLLVAAGWAVLASSALGLREVRVAGASGAAAADVRAAVAVRDGFPLMRVQLAEVRDRVEQLPAVASATVARDWPRTLQVDVTLREPVAVAAKGAGWAWVDSEGVAFADAPAAAAKGKPGTPVLRTRRGDVGALKSAAAVVAGLPVELLTKVESVDAESTDSVELALASGKKVVWGSPDRTSRKARVAVVLLRSVPDGKVYDVSAPDAPTVK